MGLPKSRPSSLSRKQQQRQKVKEQEWKVYQMGQTTLQEIRQQIDMETKKIRTCFEFVP